MAKYVAEGLDSILNVILNLNELKTLCTCALCNDYLKEPVVLQCNHTFCKVCIISYQKCCICKTIIQTRETDFVSCVLRSFVNGTANDIETTLINNDILTSSGDVKTWNLFSQAKKTRTLKIKPNKIPETNSNVLNVSNENITMPTVTPKKRGRKRKVLSEGDNTQKKSPIPLVEHYNLPVINKEQTIKKRTSMNTEPKINNKRTINKKHNISVKPTIEQYDSEPNTSEMAINTIMQPENPVNMPKRKRSYKKQKLSIQEGDGNVEQSTSNKRVSNGLKQVAKKAKNDKAVLQSNIATHSTKVSGDTRELNSSKSNLKCVMEQVEDKVVLEVGTTSSTPKIRSSRKSNAKKSLSNNNNMIMLESFLAADQKKKVDEEELVKSFLEIYDKLVQYDEPIKISGVIESTLPKRVACIKRIQKYLKRLLPHFDLIRLCLSCGFQSDVCLHSDDTQKDVKTQTQSEPLEDIYLQNESCKRSVDVGIQMESIKLNSVHTETIKDVFIDVGIQTKRLNTRDVTTLTKIEVPIKKSNVLIQTDGITMIDEAVQTQNIPIHIDMTKIIEPLKQTPNNSMEKTLNSTRENGVIKEQETQIEITLEPRQCDINTLQLDNNDLRLSNNNDPLSIYFESEELGVDFYEMNMAPIDCKIKKKNDDKQEDYCVVTEKNDNKEDEYLVGLSPDYVENTEDITKFSTNFPCLPSREKVKILENILVTDNGLETNNGFESDNHFSSDNEDLDVIPGTPPKDSKDKSFEKNTYESIITPPIQFADSCGQLGEEIHVKDATNNIDYHEDISCTNSSMILTVQPTKSNALNQTKPIPKQSFIEDVPRRSTSKPIVTSSRLTPIQLSAILELQRMNLITYITKLLSHVTHVIVSTCADEEHNWKENESTYDGANNVLVDHTTKYVVGVASGLWILSSEWIFKCLQYKCLINEEPYEVLDISGVPGPRISRLSTDRDILKDFQIYVTPPFESIKKAEVEDVIRRLSGQVLYSLEDFLYNKDPNKIRVIIAEPSSTSENVEYNMFLERYKVITVDIEWLSRTIGKFEVENLRQYTLCDLSNKKLTYPMWVLEDTN